VVNRIDTPLPGVWLIKPRVIPDRRGFFLESYNQREMADIGITERFVQDNHSRSGRGVLRGLHYQLTRPQSKLVRATHGRIFDVAVDVRRGSATFGRWTGAELSADSHLMMYIPKGFAHGFLVLSDVAEVQYKCSDFYAPEDERGIAWNDPVLGIEWPLGDLEPVLSDRDLGWRAMSETDETDLPAFTS
jgi:dTDP-4-dehydrorhamnose 3,5-epimerase